MWPSRFDSGSGAAQAEVNSWDTLIVVDIIASEMSIAKTMIDTALFLFMGDVSWKRCELDDCWQRAHVSGFGRSFSPVLDALVKFCDHL